jgi:hypothetical protein
MYLRIVAKIKIIEMNIKILTFAEAVLEANELIAD